MFKQLKIYYLLVSMPFVFLLVGATIFFDAIKLTITRNPHPQINYTIFAIIIVGGVLIILNSRRLLREAKKILEFFGAVNAKTDSVTLGKMADGYTGETACLMQMVATSGGRLISHQEQVAIEHELSNTRASLLRRNALPQYLTGLLVGMGLLGTFIGLLATLNDITVLISSFADLDMQNASPLLVFRTMIERMKAPMQSMGIAFSASMFGLLGSIILGLMMVGLRRLQADMFSVLGSEIARHIENALSYESIALGNGGADAGEAAKVLVRIEERYAEAARSQQRGLSSLMEDIKKQRTDMLRALTEQTEANNSFRGELQQLGRHLGSILNVMEKGSGEMSAQISELTVHMAGDAKETHKLLAMQVEEQKRLKEALDSYKIDERLAEAARSQQRALSSVIDDFQQQRAEMLRALTEQTEANNNSRGELRQIGGQLGTISDVIVKGNDEISTQISELRVNTAADAKVSHELFHNASRNFSNELQQLGTLIGKGDGEISTRISELAAHMAEKLETASDSFRIDLQQLGGRLGNVMEKGSGELSTRILELTGRMAAAAKVSHEQLGDASESFRSDLQQLGSQLGTVMEKGDGEISGRISALTVQMAAAAKGSNELLEGASDSFRSELQQLGTQLGSLMEKGDGEISGRISEQTVQMAVAAKSSQELLEGARDCFRSEMQQLGSELGTVMEKGSGDISTRIIQLVAHMSAAKESNAA